MKKKQLAYWQGYLRQLADLLHLRDWDVRLQEVPCADHLQASVELIYGRKVARVWLCHDWDGLDAHLQRQTMIHELLHLHINPIKHVYEGIQRDRSKGWLALGYTALVEQLEYAVDGIATAIADHYPLPPRAKEKAA